MNQLKKIKNVCNECGIEANRLTCLKKYGQEPLQKKFTISTYHKGTCDWCRLADVIGEMIAIALSFLLLLGILFVVVTSVLWVITMAIKVVGL